MTVFSGLDRLPGTTHLHGWTDWVEILAYTSALESYSLPEFSEVVERRSDYTQSESNDDMDDSVRDDDELTTIATTDSPLFRDAVFKRASDVFSYLEARADSFGHSYPFEIDSVKRTISVRQSTTSRNVYLFTLACAALRYVSSKSMQSKLTGAFELLSAEAMRRYLPTSADVHIFGKNPLRPQGPFANGLLTERLKALAQELGETPLFKISSFEVGDTGDNGLDIIGRLTLGDRLNGQLTYFGQCACTSKWVSKQSSTSASAWRPVMTLMNDPVNLCFIPFDFRRPNREWYAEHHIRGSVVIDRLRLLSALGMRPELQDPISLDPELEKYLHFSDF